MVYLGKFDKISRAKFRVKIRSLAEEARIIRHEEKRMGVGDVNNSLRGMLREHRIGIVRNEQRATLLAYAYLRGKKRSDLEGPTSKAAKTSDVMRIIKSLAWMQPTKEEIDLWLNPPNLKEALEVVKTIAG